MKKFFLFWVLFFFMSSVTYAQNKYVKISGGYSVFDRGDIPGYSVKIAYAKNIIDHPSKLVGKLFIGPELSFENGVKNPKIQNPSSFEFISKTFGHITNIVLSAKASYYPFRRIISGFNLNVAPAIGYGTLSSEAQATLVPLGNGENARRSILSFDNGIIYGYCVSLGYELKIAKKYSAGARVEVDNYNGYYNSFWGINVATHF